uniref:S100P-binding protein n=1 Tax=Poecilia formosa TaxID=48698 RepID=A0A096ME21_POEFO
SRQNPPSKNHLKPLSVYSRRVMCDQQKGPRSPVEPPDPFVNFKIKIVNDSGRKRKLGHSGTINDYNSPLKKQCSSNALSPDLGCFMDYSSSLTRNNSLSPFAAPYPVLKEETADRSVTKETVSSRLDLEHVQCGCSKEEVEKTEKIVKNMSSVFDNDINEILCLNPPKLELPSAEAEQKSGLSEALRTVNVSQTYNSGDYTVDTLYETTLPLQVQVKSKVVVPAKILDNSMEWEHHKRQYIFSVKSHMTENPGRAQEGPMTELLDLMTHVAGQTGSNGSQWQHPSDLTCRNYQKRFGNETPTMTLSEWQAQNNTHHRRFSKVPKIFERSPYP